MSEGLGSSFGYHGGGGGEFHAVRENFIPHLEFIRSFCTPAFSAKWFGTPIQVVFEYITLDIHGHILSCPIDFHSVQVIHSCQMSINFSFNLWLMTLFKIVKKNSLASYKNFLKYLHTPTQ